MADSKKKRKKKKLNDRLLLTVTSGQKCNFSSMFKLGVCLIIVYLTETETFY